MELDDFLNKLKSEPESIEFADTISVIEGAYDYKPGAFKNGEVINEAGQNEGSCKILAFAYINNLTVTETLNCFGHYYREDVLGNPAGDDHQNIRQFILDGFAGVKFDDLPLQYKS
ncbi:MAG: HopJ type III effector protein [Proteobacteria bacterium]|nr:type III effector [Pseudomonadota bacterium]NOG59995.1 HopJ type III effector protein [Pseudomonadota bacterium]